MPVRVATPAASEGALNTPQSLATNTARIACRAQPWAGQGGIAEIGPKDDEEHPRAVALHGIEPCGPAKRQHRRRQQQQPGANDNGPGPRWIVHREHTGGQSYALEGVRSPVLYLARRAPSLVWVSRFVRGLGLRQEGRWLKGV